MLMAYSDLQQFHRSSHYLVTTAGQKHNAIGSVVATKHVKTI